MHNNVKLDKDSMYFAVVTEDPNEMTKIFKHYTIGDNNLIYCIKTSKIIHHTNKKLYLVFTKSHTKAINCFSKLQKLDQEKWSWEIAVEKHR